MKTLPTSRNSTEYSDNGMSTYDTIRFETTMHSVGYVVYAQKPAQSTVRKRRKSGESRKVRKSTMLTSLGGKDLCKEQVSIQPDRQLAKVL